MTVKTLSGTYNSGYTLAAQFSGAYVTKTGSVTGSAGGYPGGNAGTGFTLLNGGTTLTNAGVIHGGAGGGGANVAYTYFPSYTKNHNYCPPHYFITRKAGPGGAGGAGVSASASVQITNTGSIIGGAGGLGGFGGVAFDRGGGGYYGEASGAAGAGVNLKAGGTVTNLGVVEGGYYGQRPIWWRRERRDHPGQRRRCDQRRGG